jgi:hypothetical protein
MLLSQTTKHTLYRHWAKVLHRTGNVGSIDPSHASFVSLAALQHVVYAVLIVLLFVGPHRHEGCETGHD